MPKVTAGNVSYKSTTSAIDMARKGEKPICNPMHMLEIDRRDVDWTHECDIRETLYMWN
jgi:hypothetical protein